MNTINNFNIGDKYEQIIRTLNNTETIGNSTLLELNSQGEQIKIINKKSNLLFEQLKVTQNKLKKIISSFKINNFLFNNNILSINNYDDLQILKTNNNNNAKDISDKIIEYKEINNSYMEDISTKLKKLKSIAIDMNNEIKKQNTYIDDLNINVDKLNNIANNNNNTIHEAIN